MVGKDDVFGSAKTRHVVASEGTTAAEPLLPVLNLVETIVIGSQRLVLLVIGKKGDVDGCNSDPERDAAFEVTTVAAPWKLVPYLVAA